MRCMETTSSPNRKPSPKPRKRRFKGLEREGSGYELSDRAKNATAGFLFGDPANLEVYDPRPSQRIGASGAWAMITRKLPPLENGIDKHFTAGSIFFVEHVAGADESGFLASGICKVQCRSPWGDLCLLPYEYATIPVEDVI